MSWHAVPNVIVDELMAKVSPAAYKVHAVIVRQTIGWHRAEDTISISQFIQMTGLSKNSVIRALRELVECEAVIRREQVVNGVSVYTYHITQGSAEIEHSGSNLGSAKSERGSSEIELGSAKFEPVGSSNSEPGVVPNLNTQKKGINKRETKKITTRHDVAVDTPSDASKKKQSSKADTRDDRLDSWQIMTYRELARLTPPHAIRDRMIAEVTEQQRWWQVVQEWIGKGWSPRNVAGMLDYYRNSRNERREGRHDEPKRDIAEEQRKMEEYLERNKKWLDPEYVDAWINGTNTY